MKFNEIKKILFFPFITINKIGNLFKKSKEKIDNDINVSNDQLEQQNYKENNFKEKDLVIVTPPIELLVPVTKLAIKTGQTTILLEKPGSLFHQELSLSFRHH